MQETLVQELRTVRANKARADKHRDHDKYYDLVLRERELLFALGDVNPTWKAFAPTGW